MSIWSSTILIILLITHEAQSTSFSGEFEESSIWPTPNIWNKETGIVNLNPLRFKITTFIEGEQIIEGTNAYPPRLSKAVQRYKLLFFPENNKQHQATNPSLMTPQIKSESINPQHGFLTELRLDIEQFSDDLQFNISERYTLTIAQLPNKATWVAKIKAENMYAAMRGLESFSQLLELSTSHQDQSSIHSNMYYITGVPMFIEDSPAYPWRGLLIDTSRHFLPVAFILNQLEAMTMVKMNVLHWHLTDEESFPFSSISNPQFTIGAWRSDLVYSVDDIQRVRSFAADRGIRVVMELDLPGHCKSWGTALPGLIFECKYFRGNEEIRSHILNPSYPNVFEMINSLFAEISNLVPDTFLHIGVDEVSTICWEMAERESFLLHTPPPASEKNNNNDNNDNDEPQIDVNDDEIEKEGDEAEVKINEEEEKEENEIEETTIGDDYGKILRDFKLQNNLHTSQDLLQFVVSHLIHFSLLNSQTPIAWEEILELEPPLSVVIQVWRNWGDDAFFEALNRGYSVILSTEWYLDWEKDWKYFYEANKNRLNVTSLFPNQIYGGEAAAWAERIDDNNLSNKIWPSAAAIAERLWNSAPSNDIKFAELNLEKWRCKASKRGIGSRPLFPDDCHLRTTFLKPYYIDIQTASNKQDKNSQIALLIFELFTNSYGLMIFFILGIILGYMLKTGFKFRLKVRYFFVLLLLMAISVLYYSFSVYH